MPRTTLLIGLALTAVGCSSSHGTTDAGPAGPDGARPDAGPVWRSCDAAFAGETGDPCAFRDSCGAAGGCCTTTVSCVLGRLEKDVSCAPGCARPWLTCEDFVAGGGSIGDFCEPSTFMPCSVTDECCLATVTCRPDGIIEGGIVACPDCIPVDWCADYAPPPPERSPCRSREECLTEGGLCWAPGSDPGCGGECFDPRTCATDSDCAPSSVCESFPAPCACEAGIRGTRCMPDCRTSDRACPAGYSCSASGRCEPLDCTDGYDCGFNQDCVFGVPGADEHGCARRPCTFDSDCECGACVLGLCHSGPGLCGPAAL